jgi:hypothetical protein
VSHEQVPQIRDSLGRGFEKLADTVRFIIELGAGPDRIRKWAQAKADADLIQMKGEIKQQALAARADERLKKEKVRQQQNIESIAREGMKALPPPEEISTEPVSEDWIARFFHECQDIGDEQMQQLWGRILAGEVARPGTFSPRTLSVVRDLTKHDANLFLKACEFVWFIPGASFVPVIDDPAHPKVEAAGLNFVKLLHLASMGLIEFGEATGGYGLKKFRTEITPTYCGQVHRLKSEDGSERQLRFGRVILTTVGQELLRISDAQGVDEIRQVALEAWKQQGWIEAKEPTTAEPPSEG